MNADRSGINRLLEVVRHLRSADGCPWDREQTLATLKPCLLEECYELLEAIDGEDSDAHCEELGDVLLQVVMQAQIRSEADAFDFNDVADRLADKLVQRHPHVFGDVTVQDSREVLQNWEAIKAADRQRPEKDCLDGIPPSLPSLQRAQRVQSRVARVGFDWSEVKDVLAKVEEELEEVRQALAEGNPVKVEEELGDLLFSVVNLARFQKVNAEDALRRTVLKFTARFREMASRIRAAGLDLEACSLEQMDQYWEAAKQDEGKGSSDPASPTATPGQGSG